MKQTKTIFGIEVFDYTTYEPTSDGEGMLYYDVVWRFESMVFHNHRLVSLYDNGSFILEYVRGLDGSKRFFLDIREFREIVLERCGVGDISKRKQEIYTAINKHILELNNKSKEYKVSILWYQWKQELGGLATKFVLVYDDNWHKELHGEIRCCTEYTECKLRAIDIDKERMCERWQCVDRNISKSLISIDYFIKQAMKDKQ